MQPSSLIFLVIMGIWAAYFVQYWVRRREHLATIRSVDAFSETMRVLERRAPLPSLSDGGQAPRTYAVSPARAMRPQVTVKRAEAYAAQPHPSSAPVSSPVRSGAVGSSLGSGAADTVRDDSFEPQVAGMRPRRAIRAMVLLVGAAGTVVFGLLAAVGVLMWWSFVVPLAMAGAGFVWLRAGVASEVRALRAARGRARRAAAGHASSRTDVVVTAPTAPAVLTETVAAAETSSPTAAPFDVTAGLSADQPVRQGEQAQPVAVEVAAVEVTAPAAPTAVAVEHEIALPEVDEDDIPLTWDPRPVPRPTYTMKAKAPDRTVRTDEVSVEAEGEHPAYDEDMPQRRIVGG